MDILDIANCSEHTEGWLRANLNDVSALGTQPEWMPDFYLPEQGIAFQCKHIVNYAAIETLVGVPQIDGFGLSGQFYSELDEARQHLVNAQNEASEQFQRFVAGLQVNLDPQARQIVSGLPFEQLLEIFNRQPRFPFSPPVGMFRFLLDEERVRNLLRRVFARISRVLKASKASKPRFCCLSWSRRLWFLLHGSHPPKAECFPAFGGP